MKGVEHLLKTTLHTFEHLALAATTRIDHSVSFDSIMSQHTSHNPPWPIDDIGSCQGPCARIVSLSPDSSQLVYMPYNEQGDRIIDFSGAGYNEGHTDLPTPEEIPVAVHLNATDTLLDDSERLQEALTHIGSLPELPNGFRGALQLGKGTFYLSKPLSMRSSGVVLQGHPEGGTVLVATEAMSPLTTTHLIQIEGEANVPAKKRVPIVDDYIPVGHTQVRVRYSHRFKQGDNVVVAVAFNQAWIETIGMHIIHPKGDVSKNHGWKPGRFEHLRRIIKVEDSGKLLTLNEPLTSSLSSKYGGGFVEMYENRRVQRVGVQYLECTFPANHLRGPDAIMQAEKNNVMDYRFAAEMFDHFLITMQHTENCWVRHVKSVWWRNFIRVGTNGVAITLEHCLHTFPQPLPSNPSKPASLVGQFAFEISGQMVLIDQCHSEYSFHAYSYKGRIPGPNVVYKSTAVAKNGDVGPHMKWSTGQLYDNCNIEGQLLIQDRYDAGTGHGWSGANSVVWNTVAHGGMVVQRPPLGNNFLVGSSSKRSKPRHFTHPWGWEESPDTMVSPLSLYMAQLKERRIRGTDPA